jgi:hypothetical protein
MVAIQVAASEIWLQSQVVLSQNLMMSPNRAMLTKLVSIVS